MTQRTSVEGLSVATQFYDFIETQALPKTGVNSQTFWSGMSDIIHRMGERNRDLLRVRTKLQNQIDEWHIARKGQPHDHSAYRDFLEEIGYLLPEGDDFEIETQNVDLEIAAVAGPQLVVPITNARYALNAANARWGSLYDCLYGTDAMGTPIPSGGYDKGRGARVVARVRVFLDSFFPIVGSSHADARRYHIRDASLFVDDLPLVHPEKFVGYRGHPRAPSAVLLKNNGLFVELVFDRTHEIGSRDQCGLADVVIESALSVIMDCEDSVVCVDADDKILAYSNWLGLMTGELTTKFTKAGREVFRTLNDDRPFLRPDGQAFSLRGCALMLIRNVGNLMTTSTILDRNGGEAFEGLVDALVTTLIAMHDLSRQFGNSLTGSVYIVKPKLHGPEEVAFTDQLFCRVEEILGLPQYTVKLGIMDEERRTSVNLKECIRAARHRTVFINTGFLDRTGDEIHTSMKAGPFSRKDFIKRKSWISAYENRNVDIGLECGLQGRAQIGKGMWPKPDQMAAMLEQKIEHPMVGANCAWVPSPTAATLHALHYHQINVFAVQNRLKLGGRRAHVDGLLEIPLATFRKWRRDQIISEVENNVQGILGYVARWVGQGIGCSTVLDINNVGLMEDRATCRISAQHVANWLHHHVVTEEDVLEVLQRMAKIVDEQNAGDEAFEKLSGRSNSLAFAAAKDLIFAGVEQPAGYTEPILHAYRRERKAIEN